MQNKVKRQTVCVYILFIKTLNEFYLLKKNEFTLPLIVLITNYFNYVTGNLSLEVDKIENNR